MKKRNTKIISVVGARPQFIKLAAMCLTLKEFSEIEHVIVHSGQHYDYMLSGQFFDELMIPLPNYNLKIGSGHHITQIASCMMGLVDVFEREMPDIVIVYGDTNTTAAAAITAAKCNIPLAHIEAGLREWDKSIPEEVNKLLTDSVTDLYFTPTESGRFNLEKEGKTENVFITGDISLDLLYKIKNPIFLDLPESPYIFVTCHRAANTDNISNLLEILEALGGCHLPVIFAIHPRTKKVINDNFIGRHPDNIKMIPPQKFWETQAYIKNAKFVVTDSGGIIKEAYFHKVPAIIIDTQTEWVETVEEGWNIVAGPKRDKILKAMETWQRPTVHSNCLGNGKAGERIVAELMKYIDEKKS